MLKGDFGEGDLVLGVSTGCGRGAGRRSASLCHDQPPAEGAAVAPAAGDSAQQEILP